MRSVRLSPTLFIATTASRLYAQARQPQTLHFVQVLWAKYPFDLINMISGRAGRVTAEHRRLLKSMKAGDKKAVVNAVQEHIKAGWCELQENFKPDYLLHLPTAADSKSSNQSWVNRQSAGWVKIHSAQTPLRARSPSSRLCWKALSHPSAVEYA